MFKHNHIQTSVCWTAPIMWTNKWGRGNKIMYYTHVLHIWLSELYTYEHYVLIYINKKNVKEIYFLFVNRKFTYAPLPHPSLSLSPFSPPPSLSLPLLLPLPLLSRPLPPLSLSLLSPSLHLSLSLALTLFLSLARSKWHISDWTIYRQRIFRNVPLLYHTPVTIVSRLALLFIHYLVCTTNIMHYPQIYIIAQVYRLSAVHCQMTRYSQRVPGYLTRYSVSANEISSDKKISQWDCVFQIRLGLEENVSPLHLVTSTGFLKA